METGTVKMKTSSYNEELIFHRRFYYNFDDTDFFITIDNQHQLEESFLKLKLAEMLKTDGFKLLKTLRVE